MLKIISLCLDAIFPPRSSELLIRELRNVPETLYFQRNYIDILYLASYERPIIQALIKENKYHHNTFAAEKLGELFETWLKTQSEQTLIIVPIPQSKERAREREHNQVATILQHINYQSNQKISTSLLQKTKHTATQTSLNRSERLKNVARSFSCSTKEASRIEAGTTIVIVDDVVTTGSTLKEARASLAPHLPLSCTIILVAIAH